MKRALLLLCLLPSLAHANPNDELAMGSWVRSLHTPSANAITEDPLGGGTFAYARQVMPELVLPKLSLWGVAAFSGGGVLGTMFQTMTTSVEYLEFTAGARARYMLWRRYLSASARLDVGATRAALDIENDGQHYRDHGWGAVTTAAVSLDLMAYAGRTFGIGMRAELGRAMESGIALAPRANRPDDGTIELPMSSASLGHLDLGGSYFAFTLIGQF